MSDDVNPVDTDEGAGAAAWTEPFDEADRAFVANKGWESPADVLRSYRHLERRIGSHVRLPGPGAAPEEVTAFWTELGRPERPEGYELPAPDDVPGYSADLADWFRQAAHAVHMPAEMAQRLHDRYVERFIEDARAMDIDLWQRAQAAEAELRAEWGPAFDRRRDLANRAIRALGGESLFAELQASGMADSVPLARAFATVGERLYAEDEFVEGAGARGFGHSPEAARQEIQRLRADAGFMSVYGDRRHPEHQAAQDRMDQLYTAARQDD